MRPVFSLVAVGALTMAVLASAAIFPETARLPADFRTTMAHYASVDRADGMTYRLYMNTVGLTGWQDQGRLPDGTIFAIEAFLAASDAGGTPLRDPEGRLVPGEAVSDVHVAEKRADWPEDGLRVTKGMRFGDPTGGDWRFAGYDPATGLPTAGLDIATCHDCHEDPRAEDAVLSRGLLDRFARTGEPAFISFTCGAREICFGRPSME
jgi:hypothetical protein